MNFIEFLDAMGKAKLASILKEGNWNVINLLETELISLLRQYYYVGGMPAAVLAHVEQKGLQEVRSIQSRLYKTIAEISRSTHQIEKCLALIWCGTVSLPNLPKRTRSSSMEP